MSNMTWDWSPVLQAIQGYGQQYKYNKMVDSLLGGTQGSPGAPAAPVAPAQIPLPQNVGLPQSTSLDASMPAIPSLAGTPSPLGPQAATILPMLKDMGPSMGMPLLLKMATTQNEYDTTPRYDQQGNAYVMSKTGQIKYLDGVKERTKVEVTDGVAYDPYNLAPGSVIPNPNKAFNPDGTPNTAYQAYEKDLRVKGAPQTNLTVNTDKSFGSNLGEGAAKILDTSSAAAQGGVKTIATVNQIRSALDTGKVSAGPGATFGQVIRQISGNDPEKLVATRQTIQGLAQLTLAARGQMKGQGQISDYEGRLLQKATSGDIDSMTVPEIKAITDVADRAARIAIKTNKSYVDKARSVPGSGHVVDFYNVDEPAPYAPPTPHLSRPGNDGWGQVRVKGQ